MVHGLKPGPLLIAEHPDLFWGVIASMYVGNALLLILNVPLIGIWVQILRVPYRILFPLIVVFCLVGAYSINNSIFDVLVMTVFGILGYYLKKQAFEPAPMVLAFLLSPMLEESLRQSLLISDGSFAIFVTKPISAVALLVAAFLSLTSLVPAVRGKRDKIGGQASTEV
jgi:putative tricarboxylic transport membrane protein